MKSDTTAEQASRRRLALLTLLHRRPRTREELLHALAQQDLFHIDREDDADTIARRQLLQFRSDMKALRLQKCDISFSQKSKHYEWHNSPFGLFLGEDQRLALAVLLDTFAKSSLPHAADIRHLLTHIASLLPPEQQKELSEKKLAFSIDLHETTNYQHIDIQMVKKIEFAIQNKRQMTFRYRASRHQEVHQHRIEPYPLHFKNGHVYLSGWSLDRQQKLVFRLDNIVPGSVEHHSTTIAQNRPPAPTYELRYRLFSPIARYHVSQHFPEQREERHPDGSATVIARISEPDLFEARRILLSYGENCVVEAPPELVKQMLTIAGHYSRTYLTPEP